MLHINVKLLNCVKKFGDKVFLNRIRFNTEI